MGFFAPSTVAGYAGDYQGPMYDRAWFNSNTLLGRYNTILSFIGKNYNGDNRNGNDQIAGKFVTNTGNYYYRRIWTIFNCVSLKFIENNKYRAISDYISGMTDRYAIQLYKSHK